MNRRFAARSAADQPRMSSSPSTPVPRTAASNRSPFVRARTPPAVPTTSPQSRTSDATTSLVSRGRVLITAQRPCASQAVTKPDGPYDHAIRRRSQWPLRWPWPKCSSRLLIATHRQAVRIVAAKSSLVPIDPMRGVTVKGTAMKKTVLGALTMCAGAPLLASASELQPRGRTRPGRQPTQAPPNKPPRWWAGDLV
jgi:hypothetical protein